MINLILKHFQFRKLHATNPLILPDFCKQFFCLFETCIFCTSSEHNSRVIISKKINLVHINLRKRTYPFCNSFNRVKICIKNKIILPATGNGTLADALIIALKIITDIKGGGIKHCIYRKKVIFYLPAFFIK